MAVPSSTSTPRFLISLSFAGEIREFIQEVAGRLAELFSQEKVLYDRFHEAEFSRARLNRYLPKLYHDKTELAVAVFSSAYPEREWCGLEWDALFDLIAKKKDSKVMLCRFNHAEPEGLYGAGFAELDGRSVDDCVRLILERLAHNQGLARSHYTRDDSRYQGMSTAKPLPVPVSAPANAAAPDPKRVLEVFGELLEPLKRILDENRDLRRLIAAAHGILIPDDSETDTDTANKLLLAFHDRFLKGMAEFAIAHSKHGIAHGPILEAFSHLIYLSMCPEIADDLKRHPDRRVFDISDHAQEGIAKMIVTWCQHGGKKPFPADIGTGEKLPGILKVTPQMNAQRAKEDAMRRYGIDPASPSAAVDLDIELEWRALIDQRAMIGLEHEDDNEADQIILKALEAAPELKHAFIFVRSPKASANPPENAKNPPFDARIESVMKRILDLRKAVSSSTSAKS